MACSELRTDVLSGRQSIIAIGRSLRQGALRSDPILSAEFDPFAEGCESETPGEVWALRDPGTAANAPGWRMRVVPNRFPIAGATVGGQAGAADAVEDSELFPGLPFGGCHEVVIECPDLRTRLRDLTVGELADVLGAWRDRTAAVAAMQRYRSVAIFRNEGFSAGASLPHCHSQILATEHVPALLLERHRRVEDYRRRTGRCLVSDLLVAERAAGRRLICEADGVAVWCPFAARTAWHVRFLPLQAGVFGETSGELLTILAESLQRLCGALSQQIGERFPFNLTVVQPALDAANAFPWFVELTPRITCQAGWELLTDIDVIPVAPEACAERLRKALSGDQSWLVR